MYFKTITFLFYRDIIEMIALCHYGCPTMHLKRVSNRWTGIWNVTAVWKMQWNDHIVHNNIKPYLDLDTYLMPLW